jgi:hypothetical protein
VTSAQVIAAHLVLGLDGPNDRLDRGAATHLAANRFGNAARKSMMSSGSRDFGSATSMQH